MLAPSMQITARPHVVPPRNVRSTLLIGSLQALRMRGHADAYLSRIPARVADALSATGAPIWLPIELADAHYKACDELHLGVDEILAIGAVVAPTAASGVQVVLRAARAGGVTPWTALANAPRYWSRMYDGSALRVVKDGPKDATILIEANPLARYAYWRIGLRGIIGELARLLSSVAYAREVAVGVERDSVTYSLQWV
jgi:hypothetical protein